MADPQAASGARPGTASRLPAEAVEVLAEPTVEAGFDALAHQLQPYVADSNATLLAVMNGGLVPLVRLIDRLAGDYRVSYCHATRYREARSGSALQWVRRPHAELQGRRVIVIDDIFDAGLTLAAVRGACIDAGAAEVITAVAFVKDVPRAPGVIEPDHSTGLVLPDRYVFGCGMDLDGRWRQLRGIYALGESTA